MKKSMAILSAALLATSCAAVFTGCSEKDTEAKTVMNVSLNPEVEFVLDSNNVVVSANALNEEGNLVLSAGVFVGKDAEEAANLFIEISADTGFLVEGSSSIANNDLEISFSGDTETAKKLFDDVKSKVESKLQELNVQVKIELEEGISEEDLQALVAECAPYLDAAEVKALEYAELVETLYESRKETVDFYSQELKKAYYEAKAIAMERTEVETLKNKVSGILAAGVNAAYDLYSTASEKLEEVRFTQLVSEDSNYQKALASFREKKVEYLNLRKSIAESEVEGADSEFIAAQKKVLETLDAAVETAEKALIGLGETANGLIDTAKQSVKTAYDSVITVLESCSIKINEHLDEIAKKQAEGKEAFFTAFETEYAAAISQAKQSWEDMKASLQNGSDSAIEE